MTDAELKSQVEFLPLITSALARSPCPRFPNLSPEIEAGVSRSCSREAPSCMPFRNMIGDWQNVMLQAVDYQLRYMLDFMFVVKTPRHAFAH